MDKGFVPEAKPDNLLTPRPKPTRARELSNRAPSGSTSERRSSRASPNSLAQYNISTPTRRPPKRGRSGSTGRDGSVRRYTPKEIHHSEEDRANSAARRSSRGVKDSEDVTACAKSSRGVSNASSSRKSSNLGKRSSSRISSEVMDDHVTNQAGMRMQSQVNDSERKRSSSIGTERAASN